MMKNTATQQRKTVTIKSASRVRANVRYFLWDLALRNFVFYLRNNLLFAVGCAVGALILTGSLLVGTSLRGSLRDIHEARLGEVKWVLSSASGHISKALADSISSRLPVDVAPVQLLTGSVGKAGGGANVHRVNIIGADERFWALGPTGAHRNEFIGGFCDSTGEVPAVINAALAKALGVSAGDEIVLRFQSTGGMAPDAPFGRRDDDATLRLPVTSVIDAGRFGDFSLKTEHFAVYNVFVPLKLLQSVNNSTGMASAILISKPGREVLDYALAISDDNEQNSRAGDGGAVKHPASRPSPFGQPQGRFITVAEDEILYIVQRNLSLADAGLSIRTADFGIDTSIHGGAVGFEIYSERVFISDTVKNIVTGVINGAVPVTSWFVNSITTANSVTPYSFVATPPVRFPLRDDQMALSAWTARDLGASVGDTVKLSYFVPLPTSGLRTDTAAFVVSAIIENPGHREVPAVVRGARVVQSAAGNEPPIDTASWLNSSLMPPYPGLAGAGNCSDWDPSIPVDLKRIRLVDEEYWGKFGGTPKAVISYERASRIFKNRFGTCTAIRIPHDAHVADNVNVIHSIDDFGRAVAASLTPAACGIRLEDVSAAVESAVTGGTDFAPIFVGLSFFTFAAALILIWLMSTLQAKSRTDEYRILTAIGYSRKHVLSIYLSEGMISFGLGGAVGVLLSPVYTLVIIWALTTVWHAAAQAPSLSLHVELLPMAIGGAAAFLCALVGMMIPIWKSTRKYTDIRASVKDGTSVIDKALDRFIIMMVRAYQRADTAVDSIKARIVKMFSGPKLPDDLDLDSETDMPAKTDFATETDLDIGVGKVAGAANSTASSASGKDSGVTPSASAAKQLGPPPFDKTRLIMLNILREKKRVAGEILILACALFVLGITQLFRQGAHIDPRDAAGGTGGFVLYGEFNSGVRRDRTDAAFARERGVIVNERGIDFISVAMRKRDGDDASCMNINKAEAPALFGVDQKQFDDIKAFSFKSYIKEVDKAHPWRILGTPPPSGSGNAVYGIADANTLSWGLGKSVGDRVTYINEHGDTLHVIIAASLSKSILQGGVIIADEDFVRHYPSTSGYRALLLTMEEDKKLAIKEAFESYHDKSGLTLVLTEERLNAFNSVENTYLSIFAVLGMVGLMLGCLGMGIIVVRNIEERRGEFAMLTTLGWNSDSIRRMLFAEHAVVAGAGAVLGLLPVILTAMVTFSWMPLVKIFCQLIVVLSFCAAAIMFGLQRFNGQNTLDILREDV